MSSEVSVLIPAHGNSPFIKFTLESIVNSTLQPGEVLIIDDGMNAGAIVEIQAFSDRLPISIISNLGKGLVDALNTGLRAAQFKYICRIDGDDLMSPSRIEDQVNFLSFNPQAVAVGSQCILIDAEGEEVGKTTYLTGCLSERQSFSFRCLLAHPSTMYLRSAALSIGGYRSKFRWMHTDIAEDFDFWLRLRTHGQIFNMTQNLTYYRVHKQQISSRFTLAQIVGTAYIAAGNISEINGRGIDKIDFSEGDYLRGLAKFESVLNNSPFMLHRIISRLQIRSLLNMSVAGNRIEKIASRILVKGLNFLFRVYINN